MLLALLLSCGTAARRYKIIDKPALQSRIEMLYNAEQGGDWETWYSLMAPSSRAGISFEQFLSESGQREFAIASWRMQRIRGTVDFHDELNSQDDEVLEIDPARISSVAEVLMEVYVERDGQRSLEADQTDYWMRYDGVWYWYWRGWPYD